MGTRSVVIPAMFLLAGLCSVAAYGQQAGGTASYIVQTMAGTGTWGYWGDNGPATSAQLALPSGLAFDSFGNLYIADSLNWRVRKVTPQGIITTVAGGGFSGIGDSGPATLAFLNVPTGLAVDRLGNLYIADKGNGRVRKVTPGGLMTTVAGMEPSGSNPCLGDGCAATAVRLTQPNTVAIGPAGDLFIADSLGVLKVSSVGQVNKLSVPDLGKPQGLAFDLAGNLYIGATQGGRARVWKVTPDAKTVTVVVGSSPTSTADGVPAAVAVLGSAAALAVDAVGNLYIADDSNDRVRRVSPDGIITTVAGKGSTGDRCDGGLATATY